jgi:hypothetical protein
MCARIVCANRRLAASPLKRKWVALYSTSISDSYSYKTGFLRVKHRHDTPLAANALQGTQATSVKGSSSHLHHIAVHGQARKVCAEFGPIWTTWQAPGPHSTPDSVTD